MFTISKLKELSFLVYGLGLSGVSVVKFFKKNKIRNFKVWDDKQKKIFKSHRTKNLKKTLAKVNYIVLAPGISLLKNKTFLVTGKLNGISRAEVKSLIEENSGKTVSSISKKLNYLIIGEKPTKRKIDNAKQLKINVIDQAEFLKMLNKTS